MYIWSIHVAMDIYVCVYVWLIHFAVQWKLTQLKHLYSNKN